MVGLNSDCTDFIIIPYYIHNYNTYVDWINSMHKYSVKNNFLYNLHTQKNLANLYVYQGRIQARAVPKIVKNMIFLRKIEIFHTKYHKTLRASLRLAQFFQVHPPNLKSWIRPCILPGIKNSLYNFISFFFYDFIIHVY